MSPKVIGANGASTATVAAMGVFTKNFATVHDNLPPFLHWQSDVDTIAMTVTLYCHGFLG